MDVIAKRTITLTVPQVWFAEWRCTVANIAPFPFCVCDCTTTLERRRWTRIDHTSLVRCTAFIISGLMWSVANGKRMAKFCVKKLEIFWFSTHKYACVCCCTVKSRWMEKLWKISTVKQSWWSFIFLRSLWIHVYWTDWVQQKYLDTKWLLYKAHCTTGQWFIFQILCS